MTNNPKTGINGGYKAILNPTDLETKKCSVCGKVKPVAEFYRRKRHTTGYTPQCKFCIGVYSSAWYQKNKAKKDAATAEYMEKHKAHVYQVAYRRRDPIKDRARAKVRNAVVAGKFTKDPCQECGSQASEFHHSNGYDEANVFTGMWLCKKHHLGLHREQRWQTN